MSKSYQTRRAKASGPEQLAVPAEATIALEEIAGSAKEGLLALAVGAGLQVMQVLMEEQVAALCGPRSKHNPERAGYRHGRGSGSVTLGGRRLPVERPRVRAADGSSELAVPAYELFSQTELLGAMALERMLAGLSTRRYRVGLEPLGPRSSRGRRPRAGPRSPASSCGPRRARWPSCSPLRCRSSTWWR